MASLWFVRDADTLLEVTVTERGLRLEGEIDASSVGLLAERLDPLPSGSGDIELELGEVTFVDSSGLRVLIDAHLRATTVDRTVVMANPSSAVRRLFDISGLGDHLVIRPPTDA